MGLNTLRIMKQRRRQWMEHKGLIKTLAQTKFKQKIKFKLCNLFNHKHQKAKDPV